MKGLIVEIASLLAIILGAWGAIHFSDLIGNFLGDKFDWDEKYLSLVAFTLTFVIIVIVVSILGKVLTGFASIIALGWLNRLLGGVFGLAKTAFIVSVLLNILLQINSKLEFIEPKTLKESLLYEDVSMIAPSILPMIMDIEIQEWWDKAYEKVEDKIIENI